MFALILALQSPWAASVLDSLYPPFCQQFLVELLQMQRRQIIQRDLAELRLDVVFDVAMIGQVVDGRI